MLTKISDDFYIDFNQVVLVDRGVSELRIYLKSFSSSPLSLDINKKIVQTFLKELDIYLGLEGEF